CDEPAEACDDGYFWEEWRVDTAEEDEVLQHLDEPAALREAAPRLLGALKGLRDAIGGVAITILHGAFFDAVQAADQAIAEATCGTPPAPRKPIVIEVRGGMVQDVLNLPPGHDCEVKDYDSIEAAEDAAGRQA